MSHKGIVQGLDARRRRGAKAIGMAEQLTIGELLRANVFCEDDVQAAVDAYLADPTTRWLRLRGSYALDVAEAVGSNIAARETLRRPRPIEPVKRRVVRSAILRARPEKR
jgi:hypothetical protein